MEKIASEETGVYLKPRKLAFVVKVYAQMAFGFLIFSCLGLKALLVFTSLVGFPSLLGPRSGEFRHFLSRPTLDLVGQGLAISAGIELAYMLFTPGPDEAIEPVILGLAASTLIIASDGKSDLKDYIVIPVYIIAIGLLFIYKRHFIEK